VAAHYPVAMRAHARLNRERILSVAYKAFADDPDVSLNTIGKLAGVGAGTLYRHFPTREDLILAVYRQELQYMVD
jgi:AcrR family transcriptional regulator